MNWFRRHIRSGSRLALFALAIQFVLAFGHVHPTQAQPAQPQAAQFQTAQPTPLSYIELVAAAIDAENGFLLAPQTAAGDHDRQPHHPLTETCDICAVMAMAASALFGTSPILHLPEAVSFLYRATDAAFAHLDPAHGPFQPRAPPAS